MAASSGLLPHAFWPSSAPVWTSYTVSVDPVSQFVMTSGALSSLGGSPLVGLGPGRSSVGIGITSYTSGATGPSPTPLLLMSQLEPPNTRVTPRLASEQVVSMSTLTWTHGSLPVPVPSEPQVSATAVAPVIPMKPVTVGGSVGTTLLRSLVTS